jgi:hypothetical protein
MKSFFRCRVIWPLPLLFTYAAAQATRPMVVDDAAITSAGNCQIESWTQRTSGQTEYWTMPACNVAKAWELAAGLGRISTDGYGTAYRSGVVQAKTVFRSLKKNDWGVGLTIAGQFRQGSGFDGDLSVLVPVSLSLLNDQVLVHANAGWLRAHASGQQNAFWATGAEWAVFPRLALTLEAYGTGSGHEFTQAGARFTIIPDKFAFDTGVGSRIRRLGAERYVTIGLTVAVPTLR